MSNNFTLSFILIVLFTLSFEACKHKPIRPSTTGTNTGSGNTGNGNNTGNGSGNGSGGGSTIQHPCDPDTVYFERQILPLIVSNCSMDGCHSAQTQADDIVLTNYQNIRAEVEPYDPWDSELYECLFDTDDLMPPPPRAPLSTANKDLIRTWILQGAKNLSCDAACDTSNISFAQDILPLIQNKCTGCHSTNNPLGGVVLENHTDVRASAVNGGLMGTILHTTGYNLMPPSGGALPSCEVNMIQKWINSGMPNN